MSVNIDFGVRHNNHVSLAVGNIDGINFIFYDDTVYDGSTTGLYLFDGENLVGVLGFGDGFTEDDDCGNFIDIPVKNFDRKDDFEESYIELKFDKSTLRMDPSAYFLNDDCNFLIDGKPVVKVEKYNKNLINVDDEDHINGIVDEIGYVFFGDVDPTFSELKEKISQTLKNCHEMA